MANLNPSLWYASSVGWSAVTAWASGTVTAVGALVRQLATPTVGNERVFRCTICDADILRSERDAHKHDQENFDHLKTHPTVKPISLLIHLVKLVCPPGGLVIDPFCGTGTTAVAAVKAGRDAIGIEQDPIFAGHARFRIDKC